MYIRRPASKVREGGKGSEGKKGEGKEGRGVDGRPVRL